jgi:hypothetical protein
LNGNLASVEIGTTTTKKLLARDLAHYAKFILGLKETLNAQTRI